MKTFLFFFFILFVFAANAQYTISYETINLVCYNQCNGKIKITGATGGVSPYTLTLVGYSQTTPTITEQIAFILRTYAAEPIRLKFRMLRKLL
jgi:hypothetical protein